MKKELINIYERLIELSDLNIQQKLWLNINNSTGYISSYDELMCSLFDDLNFDNFIDELATNLGFSQKIIAELNVLRGLLKNYENINSDKLILEDPKWRKIIEQGKLVIKLWPKEK